MTAAERRDRTRWADELVAGAFTAARCPDVGVALVAVGGYGRQDLAPHSDLDVVLVHEDAVEPGAWAADLWYPLWDSGAEVDHAVRSLSETVAAARADLRVALGMLDARHLAGDPNLTLRLRTTLLAEWRRHARDRLPELEKLVRTRADLMGELAHAAVPDLKESVGGLRDATVLKALVATWLVDVPHTDLERCRTALLDVRDALHRIAGRATDRVAPEHWEQLAEPLGLADASAVQQHTRTLGRRMTHLSHLTWRRVEAALDRSLPVGGVRRPSLTSLGHGVAEADSEVVLEASARPAEDATLLLRSAAEAAERHLVLAPATAARLVRECPPLPDPWPPEARTLLARLLASGEGLLPVWETLDETGALDRVLPEWERLRLLPHASVVHRFTVDRHVVETCVEASRLIRRVARPDVLVVAALLHDIGKGGLVEHCVAGEPIARTVATRMGFSEREVDLVTRLVRWHLLLAETATTRDLDDPATVQTVLSRIEGLEELELLAVLTEADARATAPKAWTTWRASLIQGLVARCRHALGAREEAADDHAPYQDVAVPARLHDDPEAVEVTVETYEDGARVTIIARDRVGLLADSAAVLALQRMPVRAARAWGQGAYGVSVWEVAEIHQDAAVLRQQLAAITAGTVVPADRLARPAPARLEPTVGVRGDASDQATVLEVRMDDRPGVVHLVCAALAEIDVFVRSAHVMTLGPQAVDVFYVQEAGAGALSDERAAEAAHAVRGVLQSTVTLDAPR